MSPRCWYERWHWWTRYLDQHKYALVVRMFEWYPSLHAWLLWHSCFSVSESSDISNIHQCIQGHTCIHDSYGILYSFVIPTLPVFCLPNTSWIHLSCLEEKSMRSMKYMFLLNELMITRVAPFRLAGFRSSLISFINEPLYSMVERCMEMDVWKKEPQTSGWLEMQGQMSLSMRVQREEWIQWRQWKWHID